MSDVDAVIASMYRLSDQAIKNIVDDSIVQLYDSIVEMTPVDSGQARDEWEFEKTDGYTRIFNELPYMQHLEYGLYGKGPKTVGGYSTQAPAGMVRVSALKFQQFINKSIKKFKL